MSVRDLDQFFDELAVLARGGSDEDWERFFVRHCVEDEQIEFKALLLRDARMRV